MAMAGCGTVGAFLPWGVRTRTAVQVLLLLKQCNSRAAGRAATALFNHRTAQLPLLTLLLTLLTLLTLQCIVFVRLR